MLLKGRKTLRQPCCMLGWDGELGVYGSCERYLVEDSFSQNKQANKNTSDHPGRLSSFISLPESSFQYLHLLSLPVHHLCPDLHVSSKTVETGLHQSLPGECEVFNSHTV